MAEGRYRTFAPLQELPADWPNVVAAFLAPISNLNLTAKDITTVKAPVDTQPQLSLGVDGLWRFTELEIDAAVPPGAAQVYDVVATTTANKFKAPSKEGEGEADETNYTFALQVVKHGTLPSGGGIAAAQKVGEVDWDGAKITGIRQLVGQLRATDPVSPAMPITSVPAITAKGIAGATAPVVRWSAPEGANVILELLEGAVAKLRVTAAGQIEWPGGGPVLHGEGSTLVLTGKLSVSASVALVGGGTSTTAAPGTNTTQIATTAFVMAAVTVIGGELALKAPLASPALTGEPKAPTAAPGTNTTQIATTAFVTTAVATPIAPIGAVMDWAGAADPNAQWMIANGRQVSRATYATLFALIGTTFGAGNGSTTFNIPNAEGRVTLGKSGTHALASTGGAETVALTVGQLAAHAHGLASKIAGNLNAGGGFVNAEVESNKGAPIVVPGVNGNNTTLFDFEATNNAGGGEAHNNLQPYLTLNKIIRVL